MILSVGLILITSGLTFLRINPPGTAWWYASFLLIVLGALAFIPFAPLRTQAAGSRDRPERAAAAEHVAGASHRRPVRHQRARRADPAVDLSPARRANSATDWASTPTSSRTSSACTWSRLIVGALLFPMLSRRATPRIALIVAAFFVAAGYLLFLPLHAETWQVIMNMVIAGIGSGALVAALPAAAAAAAPRGQTGIAAGLTNTTKTIGGSFASAVFGIVLATGVVAGVGTAASFSGYMITWAICGVTGVVVGGAAVLRAEAGVRRRRGRAPRARTSARVALGLGAAASPSASGALGSPCAPPPGRPGAPSRGRG